MIRVEEPRGGDDREWQDKAPRQASVVKRKSAAVQEVLDKLKAETWGRETATREQQIRAQAEFLRQLKAVSIGFVTAGSAAPFTTSTVDAFTLFNTYGGGGGGGAMGGTRAAAAPASSDMNTLLNSTIAVMSPGSMPDVNGANQVLMQMAGGTPSTPGYAESFQLSTTPGGAPGSVSTMQPSPATGGGNSRSGGESSAGTSGNREAVPQLDSSFTDIVTLSSSTSEISGGSQRYPQQLTIGQAQATAAAAQRQPQQQQAQAPPVVQQAG